MIDTTYYAKKISPDNTELFDINESPTPEYHDLERLRGWVKILGWQSYVIIEIERTEKVNAFVIQNNGRIQNG